MKTYRYIPVASMLWLAVLTFGCGGAEPATQETGDRTPTPADVSPAATEAVEYEPAYPSEVSDEGLNEQDVAQQDAGHSHEGAEHSHGPDGHSHEGDESDDDHDHSH